MELLLIRHALPIRRIVTDGPADPELDELGHAQAQRLAEYLSTETLDAIYASPLLRARQTAAPVAGRQGLETIIEDDVAEYDRNSNEYVPVEELKAANDPRWHAILNGESIEGGETHEEFRERIVAGVERIIAAHPGNTKVAVVCHGGVIGHYSMHVLDLPPVNNGFFYPNYTSIHRFAAARSGERSIVTLNETAHLRNSDLPMGIFQR